MSLACGGRPSRGYSGNPMRAMKPILLAAAVAVVAGTGCYSSLGGSSNYTPIPFRNDKVHRRYDKPVLMVAEAVKQAIENAGIITKPGVASRDNNTYIVSGRVDTRHVWVEIKPDPQSANISYVTFQTRTKSSWVVGGRNPDLVLAGRLAEDTTLKLISIVQNTPPTGATAAP